MRRTTAYVVPDEVSVMDVIAGLSGFDVLILDVDNTLVPDGASPASLEERVASARMAAAKAGIGRMIAVSNGSRDRATGRDGVVWQVNKPFTRRSRLSIGPDESVAVVGDRILIDGVLAWRWNAPVFLRPWFRGLHAPRSRAMRTWAGWVERKLFEVMPLEGEKAEE